MGFGIVSGGQLNVRGSGRTTEHVLKRLGLRLPSSPAVHHRESGSACVGTRERLKGIMGLDWIEGILCIEQYR